LNRDIGKAAIHSRSIAAISIQAQKKTMTLIIASLLVAPPAQQLGALPVARGPAGRIGEIEAGIAKCRAPAKIVRSGAIATIVMTTTPSDRAYACLSEWIATRPGIGLVKCGFVGRERR
jgi:hypothetical protein